MTWAAFARFFQNLDHLVFVDSVTVNMRHTGCRINIEPNLHICLRCSFYLRKACGDQADAKRSLFVQPGPLPSQVVWCVR